MFTFWGQPAEAMKNDFEYVWLKSAIETDSLDGMSGMYPSRSPITHGYHCAGNLRLTPDNLESVVIVRLELDPQSPE